MWDVGGERRVRNQRKLLQTNPCIIFDDVLPAPTAKQKLGQWTLIITLELTLTMNNKVASSVFSYFRLTRDVWVWHCHVSCLVSWHYSGHCILWWSWPVSMSWYVTLLSFWFVFTRDGSWSSLLQSLIMIIIPPRPQLLNVPENRVFQFLCVSHPSDKAWCYHTS